MNGTARKVIGIAVILIGTLSLARLFDRLRLNLGLMTYLSGAAVYALLIPGGILVAKRRRLGLVVVAIALALQMPMLQIGRFSYVLPSYPVATLSFWPVLSLTFGGSGTPLVHFGTEPELTYLGLNLTAALYMGMVGEHIDRLEAALIRLRRGRGTDT